MAAELEAHGRKHALREGVVLAGAEARIECGGQHLGRYRLLDRGLHGPTAFARILDHAGKVGERRVLGERRGGEIEQPGGDDAAMAPHLGDVGEVEVVATLRRNTFLGGALQDVQSLRIGLHHSVFDAVVDHLDEMAGAMRPAIEIAARGGAPLAAGGGRDLVFARRKRGEDRVEAFRHGALAADHQTKAALEAEDAAAGADVDIMDAVAAQYRGARDVVLIEGVATIDDDVVAPQQFRELGNRRFGRRAGRHHDPDHARQREPLHEGVEARHRRQPLGGKPRHHRCIRVICDAFVPPPLEAAHDIGAHAAEADHSDLHVHCSKSPIPYSSIADVSSLPACSMHPVHSMESDPMSKLALLCGTATLLLCGGAALLLPGSAAFLLCGSAAAAAGEAVPNFSPDPETAWTSDRPKSDDFLPPPSGPGPVLSDKAHPYIPNGQGQSTYRVADLTNPILKPWVVERMRKA